MAKKGSFSKVYDKNGDYVDVEAARFDGTRTFQMQGDVSATQTWNGDSASALTLNTSIGAKKVTTDKINDKAVQTGQIDDGAVGLTQIATNAMNGTVQDNDSKLATHAAVKTYVDSQISGQGTYLGKHTVAEINAMVTDNLHNGDRVMTSDSGTINLGPGGVGFDVEAGEDLILYKSGSTVQWDSMDGNFKTKQTAVSDPTASGTGLTFIDSASQDENGEMTLSKKTVQDGTTSQKGVVQLEDSHTSTSTTKAATPNSVKEAYDLASTANSGLADKQDKPSSATENNIAVFNGSKSTKDSGKSFLPSTSTWDGTSNDKVPTAKAVQARLDLKADANKVVACYDAQVTKTSTIQNLWYKIADVDLSNTYNQRKAIFDVRCGRPQFYYMGELCIVVRTSNNAVLFEYAKIYCDNWESSFNFKIVSRGTVGNCKLEIWCNLIEYVCDVSISYRSGSNYNQTEKSQWNFYSYSNEEGTTEPQTDAQNNITANPVDIVYRQHNVPSATAGNFAGLDSNGNLTDSGKKASDFATSAQGGKADSAIQGVKVNNTTLTPDANKVVNIPLATTSADGAVQLAGSIGATVASENNKAATEKAVRDAINALDAEVTSSDGTNVQVKVTEADGKISAVNVTTDNTENKNNKVTSVRAASSATDIAYPSEKAVRNAINSAYPKKTFSVNKAVHGLLKLNKPSASTEQMVLFRVTFAEAIPAHTCGEYVGCAYVTHTSTSGVVNVKFLGQPDSGYVKCKLIKSSTDIKVAFGFEVVNNNRCGCIEILHNTASYEFIDEDGTDYTDNVDVYYTAYGTTLGTAIGSSSRPVYVNTNGKVTACTNDFEHTTNKVSSWQSTPDDTHYPSEKLVKDGLDGKSDANKVVAIADSTYTRENENGNGWNKLARIQNNGIWRNNIGFFDLCYANLGSAVNRASLYVNVRWDSDRTAANILDARVVFDNYNTAFNVAVVNKASSSSVITEIWAYLPKGNYSMSLSYRSGSTKIGSDAHSATLTNDKDNWEFFSYVATSESKPVEDLANNVKVVDATRITNQHTIATPTNNNLVAMDANGLVKDSGLTKSSVENAISSAGSAIQGVKVNNATLTPDANKVVTVPLATTSADGAMSAEDKTRVDNAVIVSNSIIYTASGNTRSYYKVAEIDVLQNYTSAILSCDYLVAPGNDHGERGTLDLNFRVKDDTSWGLKDFYARQEYSTVVNNYGLQFIVIATKNTTGTHIDLYVSLACGLTGFELSRRFRKSGGTTLGDEWTFVDTPTASSTAPTVPEGAVSSTITPEVRDVVTLTSSDNIDSINVNTTVPKNFIVKSSDFPSGTFPTGVSATNCYLQCFGHANRQNQVLYVESNGVQYVYIRKATGGAPPNLTWMAWQSGRDASWINSGTFGTARIADDAITAAKVKDGEELPVNISGNAATSTKPLSTLLTRSDDLNNVKANSNGDVRTYHWNSGNVPTNSVNTTSTGMMQVFRTHSNEYCVQMAYICDLGLYKRVLVNGTWGEWSKILAKADVTNTYSATGTEPVNGTAVRAGIEKDSVFKRTRTLNTTNPTALLSITSSENQRVCIQGSVILSNGFDDNTSCGDFILDLNADGTVKHKRFYSEGVGIYLSFVYDSTTRKTTLLLKGTANYSTGTIVIRSAWYRNSVLGGVGNIPIYAADNYTGTPVEFDYVKRLHTADVAQTYSSSSSAPISGAGVSAALATSLTDVEFVAAQSGGGGNLNKTKNGSTTSVLAFMTTAEAHSLWTNAKANAS